MAESTSAANMISNGKWNYYACIKSTEPSQICKSTPVRYFV